MVDHVLTKNQYDSETATEAVHPVQPRLSAVARPQSLRMFTEEQVADMLQVSLSQLRKWRMRKNEGRRSGPPFRKIGRLVRYPEAALRAYVNGEEQTDQ
jgi:hypothetical protein